MSTEKIIYLNEPGFYQIENNDLKPVSWVDYNLEWVQIFGACKVSVINGKVDRIVYLDQRENNEQCKHLNKEVYTGFLESFEFCNDCNKKVNP